MVSYTLAKTPAHIEQILSLQKANLPENISKKELTTEGFVTLKHEVDLLWEMNAPYAHILAFEQDILIGYALVMIPDFRDRIPTLFPMFEILDKSEYKDASYFVMGQICIAKGFRGQGIFQGLYNKLRIQMQTHFDFCITLIAHKNPRSIRAHERLGFKKIYSHDKEDAWNMVLWNWG